MVTIGRLTGRERWAVIVVRDGREVRRVAFGAGGVGMRDACAYVRGIAAEAGRPMCDGASFHDGSVAVLVVGEV